MQIKAFILNHEIGEDEIVAMNVPKFNETQFNTGIAMIHFKSEESVVRALELKGTHIGERCDGSALLLVVIVLFCSWRTLMMNRAKHNGKPLSMPLPEAVLTSIQSRGVAFEA